MSPLLPALGLVLCVLGATVGYVLSRSVPAGARSLIPVDPDADNRPSRMARLREGLARRFGQLFLAGMSPKRQAEIRRRIDIAGRPGGLTLEGYGGLKAASTIIGALFGTLGALLIASPLAAIGGLLIGWLQVDLTLIAQGKARQARITRDLPDFLDVLTVTVGAGLGFRSAMSRVADALGGPVGDEVRLALTQMGYGAPRRAALEGIRDRNDSPELAQFITALLQAEELGAPLSEALASIAEDMRKAFQQSARRNASRAAPRVSLVISLLGVPAFLIVLMTALYISSNIDFGALGG
jgi:tight adherence protein C